jgi:hypothetical protein
VHSIPIIIYYDVSNIGQCAILSTIYLYYYLYVIQIFFHGLIPIIFLSIFGLLTFEQLKKIERRHRRRRRHGGISSEKQLSRMLLLMSIAIILSSIPYCLEQFLNVLFIRDERLKSSYFYLFHVITHILYYTNPVSSFYVYYISTPNFRILVQKIILCRRHVRYVVYYEVKTVTSSQSTSGIM